MFPLTLFYMFLFVKFWGSFDFCKHGLLIDHRDESVTVNVQCPFESVVPSFSASETNQEALDVNRIQDGDLDSIAKKSLLLILNLGGGGNCLHIVIPSLSLLSLMIRLYISSHEEVESFSPPLGAGLVLSLGVVNKNGKGELGQLGGHAPTHSLGTMWMSLEQMTRARTVTEDRQGTPAEGIPHLPAPSHPAADHRCTRKPSQDQKNCPVELTGLLWATTKAHWWARSPPKTSTLINFLMSQSINAEPE